MDNSNVTENQRKYYEDLLKTHGHGVKAVASGKQIYKDVRYDKLSKIFNNDDVFTIHDVGCGVGHYYEYIKDNFSNKDVTYSGTEITQDFVDICNENYPTNNFFLNDLSKSPFKEKYDYLIFGGTFYHLAGSSPDEYFEFVKKMLKNGFDSSIRGIAFNFVTEYVDYRLDDLFYCELNDMIIFLINNISRFFTIDHSSPLYEYTICVYHEEYIRELYPQDSFTKYFKK